MGSFDPSQENWYVGDGHVSRLLHIHVNFYLCIQNSCIQLFRAICSIEVARATIKKTTTHNYK